MPSANGSSSQRRCPQDGKRNEDIKTDSSLKRGKQEKEVKMEKSDWPGRLINQAKWGGITQE